jgi:diguanylate cyclase (GGDEF)-like protein
MPVLDAGAISPPFSIAPAQRPMLDTLSATEVAFLQIAVLQAVAALVWGLGAWFVRDERVALAHWSGYAGSSSATWALLASHLESPPLLAVLIGVCSALALRRGIRVFVGRTLRWPQAVPPLALVLLAGALGGDARWRPLQAGVNFGVLAWLYLGMALDLQRHARRDLQWRLPWLLALPLLLGALGFGSRALRALVWPGSVLAEMNVHSALNVGSALSYIVLVLLMHATLMALVVARLVRRLQQLARRDVLTGLLNRRAVHAALDELVRQRRRAADTFTVLMIDVDHFKSVNDAHGHDAGDHALVHIARLMTQTLRTEDRIGRFGGEEFVALLPGSDLRRALAEAERLRLGVLSSPLVHGELRVALSVSIGLAEWAGPGEDPSRLLVRADDALYRAKRLGRNRVEADSGHTAPATPRLARG